MKNRDMIMLKLSGEVLAGDKKQGLDLKVLEEVAGQLKKISDMGKKIAVVPGGGNIFRGLSDAAIDMNRVRADQMGMLATVINGIALMDAVRNTGTACELFTAVSMSNIARHYTKDKAQSAINNGAVVIITGGTGNPFFSTDSAAALRAAELECKILYKGTKVDGVYDKDPVQFSDAVRYENISMNEVIKKRLGVMDLTAATLCLDNNIKVFVYKMTNPGSIFEAVNGTAAGTSIS